MPILPDFYGTNLFKQPVSRFISDVRKYLAIKNIPVAQWWVILDELIQEPACTKYEAAKVGLNPEIMHPADGADDEAQLAVDQTRFTNHVNWLLLHFHGQEVQNDLKATLPEMQQGPRDSPREFYHKVVIAVREAGYGAAMRPEKVEEIWMNGIHEVLCCHVRSLNDMPLADKVTTAYNYWKVRNTSTNHDAARYLCQEEDEYEEEYPVRQPPRRRCTPQPYEEEELQPSRIIQRPRKAPIWYEEPVRRNEPEQLQHQPNAPKTI